MNTHIVIRSLGKFLAVLAVPSLLCAIWAVGNDRYEQASLFILTVTITIVLSSVLLIAIPRHASENAGLKETVTFLLFAWLSLAILGAIPFVLVSEGKLMLAVFEAVSCATTTGASLLSYDEPLSPSLVAWRGILHFIGATLSVSGTILLFAISSAKSDLGGRRVQAKSLGLSLRLSTYTKLFAAVGSVIGMLALIPYIQMTLSGLSMREAFAFSVGAATTGQVLPYHVGAQIAPNWSGVILAVVLLVASIDTSTLLSLPRDKWRALKDKETLWLIGIFVVLVALLFFHQKDATIFLAFSEAASILSTSGLMLPPDKVETIGIPVLIFFGFIGGSAISATGGMKLFRLRLLVDRTGHEFSRLAQPNAILKVKSRNTHSAVQTMMTVWVYFLGFAVVAVGLASYLSILGIDFDNALVVSTGAITNSAALFRTDLLGDYHSALTQLILTFSMIFGRLELLLLLSLIFRA